MDRNFMIPIQKNQSHQLAQKNFLESLNYRSRDLGRLVGVDHAEGFTVERYLAVNSLGDLMLNLIAFFFKKHLQK